MTSIRTTMFVDLSLIAALLVTGCVDDGEPAELDDGSEDAALDARPELDIADVVAPPPGTSVWSEAVYTDGTTHQFVIHTTLEGATVLEELDHDELLPHTPDLHAAPRPVAALSACSDDAYNLFGWRWDQKLRWYFHAGTTPSELTADEAEAALKAGTSNVTSSKNSCGMDDQVSASHEYLGRKSKAANISSGGNCNGTDGYNMVSFGDLPQGVLAVACVWYDGQKIAKEGDILFNKADFTWTTNPGSGSCSNRWSLRAVMTHERGHTFGLDHVSEGTHGNLTMSPSLNGPCQDSESTLGEGDVLGLRHLY